MKSRRNKIAVWLSVSLAMAAVNSLRAAVIGWWRFEDNPGFTADSSEKNYGLTPEGETGPTQVDAESGFDNPLAQTDDENLKAADFNGTNNFYINDKGSFNVEQHLTMEAYFRFDESTNTISVLAGQFASTLAQQSWFFGIRNTGELQFRASSVGNMFANYTSDFADAVQPGKDYYAAVVFDGAAARCTIYLKNLTDGGKLEQSVTTGIPTSSLFNSNVPLNIGSIVDASNGEGDSRLRFDGRIDEVRISNTSLLPEQLLVNESANFGSVVGYWRFEDSPGFAVDSGPMNLTLSRTDSTWPKAATPGIVTRVPLTRDVSRQHANFGEQSGWFTTPAPTTGNYVSEDFTIEAFVRQTAVNTNTVYIFSQWDATISKRSYAFFVGDGGTYAQGELCLSLSDSGQTTTVIQSDWEHILLPEKDYYVAVSFDKSDKTSGVTFYLRNLTDNGPLLSKKTSHSLSKLFTSDAIIKIGALDSAKKRSWIGLMDEVRLSCTALPEEQLLGVTQPPTATHVVIR